MTLTELCENNQMTDIVTRLAEEEGVTAQYLLAEVAAGRVAIPANKNRKLAKPFAVGRGLRTKVNANIGTSPDHVSLEEELLKLKACVRAGADAVMDLSTGGNLTAVREMVL